MTLTTATFIRRTTLVLGATASAVGLLACGGGGTSTEVSAPSAAPPVTAKRLTALYLTDDFSAEHDAVWISVTRVTAVTPNGEVALAIFSPAKLVNVPTLRRTGDLIATADVPADATAIRIHVGSTARLQALDGSQRDVTLASSGGYLEARLEGWKSDSGALALDFDLPRFTLQGNILTPVVRTAGASDFSGWDERFAEVKGTVTAVTANSVTLSSPAFGLRVYALDANTTYVSRRSATWVPVVGERVEISAAVSGQGAEALQFTARRIEDESDSAASDSWKVKGLVTAVNGSLVSVKVQGSEHLGVTGTTTFDTAQAGFSRGSLASLVPGVRLEAYLSAVGAGWRAVLVEVEGAAKSNQVASSSQTYAEVKGRVEDVAGNTVTLTTVYTERFPNLARGARLSIDLTSAYFKKGALSCVVTGNALEIKGHVDAAGTFRPVQVELEGGCAAAAPVSGVSGAGTPTSPPLAAVFLEAKGTVAAVRPGEFDLTVYRVEYAGLSLSSVTVRHDAATVFKQLASAQLAAGQFVEVKGSYLNGVIQATKVERD